MDRNPRFAGPYNFYPDDESEITKLLDSFFHDGPRKDALGVIAPHAGYIYSGPVAGDVYSKVNVTNTVVVLSPNHTGAGRPLSLWARGTWHTPLGGVRVDEAFAEKLRAACGELEEDTKAHAGEHSLEVQLPFIRRCNPEAAIVPVTIATHDIATLRNLGDALAETIRAEGRNILIVASSDMTHQESAESAKRKDMKAIDEVTKLDEEGLLNVVIRNNISMCGVAPAVTMLRAAKGLGAASAELVSYRTSGDATGDYHRVVAYAGVVVQ